MPRSLLWSLGFAVVLAARVSLANDAAARPTMAAEACRAGESYEQYRARLGWPGEYDDVLRMSQRQVPAAWSYLDVEYSDCETCPANRRPPAAGSAGGPRKVSEFHFNFFVNCIFNQRTQANRYVGHFPDGHATPACPSDDQLARFFASSGGDGRAQLASARSRYLTQTSPPSHWGISDFMGARDCMLARAVRLWQRQCYYLKNRRVRSAELASCPNEFDGSNALLCGRSGGQADSAFCRAIDAGFIATRERPDARMNERSAKGGGDDVRESGTSPANGAAGSDAGAASGGGK